MSNLTETNTTDTTDDATQGAVLIASAAQAGLEQIIAGYLSSLEHVIGVIVHAAEGMSEDGLSLADFAVLLRGEDI